MKNIHLIPTDKPSRFSLNSSGKYHLTNQLHTNSPNFTAKHIYITSNEEIKEGDWIKWGEAIYKANKKYIPPFKKIILTTDQDLIKNGVQAISGEFLEWFVNNPSCEEVEVEIETKQLVKPYDVYNEIVSYYKIIIPKQEQKQHLIDMMRGDEELGLYEEPKTMYSEEEIKKLIINFLFERGIGREVENVEEWFKQFKKK